MKLSMLPAESHEEAFTWTRLPSSRALADDLGVSRTTTLLAVQQLQAEGYLTGR